MDAFLAYADSLPTFSRKHVYIRGGRCRTTIAACRLRVDDRQLARPCAGTKRGPHGAPAAFCRRAAAALYRTPAAAIVIASISRTSCGSDSGPGSDRRIHGPPIALAQAFASTLLQRLHDADQRPLEDPRAVAGAVVARTVDHIRQRLERLEAVVGVAAMPSARRAGSAA